MISLQKNQKTIALLSSFIVSLVILFSPISTNLANASESELITEGYFCVGTIGIGTRNEEARIGSWKFQGNKAICVIKDGAPRPQRKEIKSCSVEGMPGQPGKKCTISGSAYLSECNCEE